jgi:3-(3-hydroxy-phenyl)propionate hydroxylase
MRFRPDTRVRSGAVVRLEGPHQSLVGTPLPQPRVLRAPHHEVTRLDDVLSHEWSLLGIGVGEADWATTTAQQGLSDAFRVDVYLDDRAARDHIGRTGIADADGRLDALFAGLAGHFVLVRPDRLVAAVFTANQAGPVAAQLRRLTGSTEDDTSAARITITSRLKPQAQKHP